jgi:hypothetical protein
MSREVNTSVAKMMFVVYKRGFIPFNTFDELVVYITDSQGVSPAIARIAASTVCEMSDIPVVKPEET